MIYQANPPSLPPSYLSGSSASDYLVYSACDDETLRVGRLTYEAAKGKKVNVEYSEFADLLGSTSKLQCLDVNILRGDLVCAGNYAGDIFVYSLTQKNIDESSSVTNPNNCLPNSPPASTRLVARLQ